MSRRRQRRSHRDSHPQKMLPKKMLPQKMLPVGVCCTPPAVVKGMVHEVLGRLLANKTPEELVHLRILDLACGEGAFLIGIYRYLLRWYGQWYVTHDPQHWCRTEMAGGIPLRHNGERWCLTPTERQRILSTHVYGIELDAQTVAIARTTLLQEWQNDFGREGDQTSEPALARELEQTSKGELEKIRTILERQVLWGNGILEPDWQGATIGDISEGAPVDWHQAFPEVMGTGGFDGVLGNPPYVDSEWMALHRPEWRRYCGTHYRAASGNWDLYCVFIERSLQVCKPGGLSSLIVPNKLGSAAYGKGARQLLTQENCLLALWDYARVPVFPKEVYPLVYLAQKSPPVPPSLNPEKTLSVAYFQMAKPEMGKPEMGQPEMGKEDKHPIHSTSCREIPYQPTFTHPHKPWPIFVVPEGEALVEQLSNQFPSLGAIATVCGAATVAEAYQIQPLIEDNPAGHQAGFPLINSGTIDRYEIGWGRRSLRYLGQVYRHPIIPEGHTTQMPQNRLRQTQQPKLIVASMTRALECVLDKTGGILAGKSTSLIFLDSSLPNSPLVGRPQPKSSRSHSSQSNRSSSGIDLRILLAILNSKLLTFYYQVCFGGDRLQGSYLPIGPSQLRTLPIATPRDDNSLSNHTEAKTGDRLVELVDQRLSCREKDRISDIEQTIDRLIYDLYDLTPAHIRLVETRVEYYPG